MQPRAQRHRPLAPAVDPLERPLDPAPRDRQLGCDLAEATKEIVVYDVAEKQLYRLVGKRVARWQLEGAFGGGSVDFVGKVTRVEVGLPAGHHDFAGTAPALLAKFPNAPKDSGYLAKVVPGSDGEAEWKIACRKV